MTRKKMRIALWQPATPDLNRVPALGLLSLAAVLKREGHEVRVFHAGFEPEAVARLWAFAPEVLGVSAVTVAMPAALVLGQECARRFPSTLRLIGGPHPTARPEDGVQNGIFHIAVRGEAERTLPLLVDAWDKNHANISLKTLCQIPGLAFSDDGKWCETGIPVMLSAAELDSLPLPDFDSMALDDYFRVGARHGLFVRGRRVLPIMTSRGCPQTCTFCCRVMGTQLRAHSPNRVREEMLRLVEHYGVDEVFCEDDNFFADRRRAVTILKDVARMPRSPFLKFANGVRVDRLDAELLDLMAGAGVDSVSFGLESGSPRTLALMKKRLDLSKVRAVVELVKEKGFRVGGNCILGYPGETIETLRESVTFLRSLDLDSSAIVNLIPFPGTEVRALCEANGWLTPEANEYGNYYFRFWDPMPLVATPDLSAHSLRVEMRKAYRRLYFRPAVLAGLAASFLGLR